MFSSFQIKTVGQQFLWWLADRGVYISSMGKVQPKLPCPFWTDARSATSTISMARKLKGHVGSWKVVQSLWGKHAHLSIVYSFKNSLSTSGIHDRPCSHSHYEDLPGLGQEGGPARVPGGAWASSNTWRKDLPRGVLGKLIKPQFHSCHLDFPAPPDSRDRMPVRLSSSCHMTKMMACKLRAVAL